jgi:hypothetical protein
VSLLVSMVSTVRIARAQVDPRGPVRTIPTAHFRVHFRADSGAAAEAMARDAAGLAERAYRQLSREFAPPAGPIELLLADNVDFSNGFAQVFPTNRIVVYAVPPIEAIELRAYTDWLQLVITHELTHIFHLDRARGIWALGRTIFGRNPALFPNALTPSWVKEGLAIQYESKFTGTGRVYAAESQAVGRAAAAAGAIPPVSQWSAATSRFPRGGTAYAYGALLMTQARRVGGDSGMRRFVDATASYPIPFLLNRAASIGFGRSFTSLLSDVNASLQSQAAAARDSASDAQWRVVSQRGWYAAAPRWLGRDSVIWSASDGRDVAGVYVAEVGTRAETGADTNASTYTYPYTGAVAIRSARVRTPVRRARRNSLAANVPAGGDSVVFAQDELPDPYRVYSDLYIGRGAHERRLTYNARLTAPDVRRDGAIVAVQLHAQFTRLVRVSSTGEVTAFAQLPASSSWAEPRWSPQGDRLAAIQFLPSGEQRVVVLDTSGAVQEIVAGGWSVFASPSFTPDGARLVWASDRSRVMQIETARLADARALRDPLTEMLADTSRWRTARSDVRVAARFRTGAYEPSVSPDGSRVVALLYAIDGYHVAVAPLDTAGAMALTAGTAALRDPPTNAVTSVDLVVPPLAPSRPFRALRQLLPVYWLPVVGSGRLDHATYGVASGGADILGRHAWAADAELNPALHEWDAAATYQYAGLGVPVIGLGASQAWDATFGVTDAKNTLLGTIGRRRRFLTASATFSRPRIRSAVAGTLGVRYELRDFNATVDSLLGGPSALLRRGTRYPEVFVGGSFSTLRRSATAIAYEAGVALSNTTSYRWRQDVPSNGSWRTVLTGRAYAPLDLPGFSRHVFSLRTSAGWTDTRTATEFDLGGVSGVASSLLPGVSVGDPSRAFPVRGVASGVQRGIRALSGSAEYRVPLTMFRRAPSPAGVYLDRLSLTLFSDAGRAWCPSAFAAQAVSAGLCDALGARDGWIGSAGAEVVLDAALQYDIPYRVRFGAAAPFATPIGIGRRGTVYISLGSYF